MMRITKLSKLFFILLFGVFLLTSCSNDNGVFDDDQQPEHFGAYANGFFVTNEGQFPNDGSVTFVANNLMVGQQNIYKYVNGEAEGLGGVVQSMFFDEQDRAFVISNGANFITVVDRYSFENINRISGDLIDMPRYGVAEKGKAYITSSSENYVTVIDLNTLTVSGSIDIGGTSEYIIEENDMLYVQKAAFDTGNEVAVIDPATDQMVANITTDGILNSIAVSDHYLYALTSTSLQKFDLNANYALVDSVPLDYEQTPDNLDVEDANIYYTAGRSVYRMTVTDTVAPTTALLTYTTDSGSFAVAYGFEVEDNAIYIADAGDFTANGSVYVYDLTGKLIKQIQTGVAPNGFYFND